MCAENCSICNASRLAVPLVFHFHVDRAIDRDCVCDVGGLEAHFVHLVIETLPKSAKPKTIETNFPLFHVVFFFTHCQTRARVFSLALFQFSTVFFVFSGRFVIWRLARCSALFIDAFCHRILCRMWNYIGYTDKLISVSQINENDQSL